MIECATFALLHPVMARRHFHVSPGRDRSDRDKHREKDKVERKRDVSFESAPAETKRYKSDEVKSKQNGDGVESLKKRSGSRDRAHRDSTDNHVITPTSHSNKKSPRRKESPDKSSREIRKAEKHGSKKSKHH